MIWAPQASHLAIKIQSKFEAFFKTPSWTSFCRLLSRLGAKMADFGTPLAPSGVQNGAQNRPSGAQEALYAPVRAPPREGPGTDLSPRSILERHFVDFDAPGHHFGRFWMDFG